MKKKDSESNPSLLKIAHTTIKALYREKCHTVGAALLCDSGKIYSGVNLDTCGYGPCAEAIALGNAIVNGETQFNTIVAVNVHGVILAPCGNCRQLFIDHAPQINVILSLKDQLTEVMVQDLLPHWYKRHDNKKKPHK